MLCVPHTLLAMSSKTFSRCQNLFLVDSSNNKLQPFCQAPKISARCDSNLNFLMTSQGPFTVYQACPWDCHSYRTHGKHPLGWDRHKLLWDGNGTDKYVPWTTLGLSMGMSFLWESHGKRPMGWDRHKLLLDGKGTDKYVPWTTLPFTVTNVI